MIRRVTGALLLAVILLTLTAPHAGAARVSPTGTVRLASQTTWLRATGSFQLHLTVASSATDMVDVAVTLHSRVSSRSAFQQTLLGRAGRVARTFPSTAVTRLPTDADGNRVLDLPAVTPGTPSTPLTLPPLREGVYPVTVELRIHGGAVLDSFVTHLVRLPDDPTVAPMDVAWVQPVAAAPALHPDGPSSLAPDQRATVREVLAAVGAHAQVPLTLDVNPETAAALDPSELTGLRRALADGQLLASPYVEVDPAALLTASVGDDLALQRQVGGNALFSALGQRGDPLSWSAPAGLTEAALTRLRTLGVTRLVLPEVDLTPLSVSATGGRTLTRPFALTAGDGVVQAASVDPDLVRHFRNRGDQVLAAHRLLADLAVLFFDLPGTTRGIAVRPPPGWRATDAFLDVALGGLGSTAILHPVTLTGLFDGVTPLGSAGHPTVRSLGPSTGVTTLPRARLAAAHAALEQLVGTVGAGSDLVTSVRNRLLVGESTRLSTRDRDALLDAVTAARDAVRENIQLPDRRSFRLTARQGTIPLTIVNRNPFRVNVQLRLSSDKLEFTQVHAANRTQLLLPDLLLDPGNRTITVPVEARTSGTFSLRAALLTPEGAQLGQSRLTIRSTVFSGVGIVLSIGAGLFLALWWASHWRTARRARTLVEAPLEAAR